MLCCVRSCSVNTWRSSAPLYINRVAFCLVSLCFLSSFPFSTYQLVLRPGHTSQSLRSPCLHSHVTTFCPLVFPPCFVPSSCHVGAASILVIATIITIITVVVAAALALVVAAAPPLTPPRASFLLPPARPPGVQIIDVDYRGILGALLASSLHQGRWKRVEGLGVQAMGTFKMVLGQEHPDTLTIMGSLASTYQN